MSLSFNSSQHTHFAQIIILLLSKYPASPDLRKSKNYQFFFLFFFYNDIIIDFLDRDV